MQNFTYFANRAAALFGAVAMTAFMLTYYFSPATSAALSTGIVA